MQLSNQEKTKTLKGTDKQRQHRLAGGLGTDRVGHRNGSNDLLIYKQYINSVPHNSRNKYPIRFAFGPTLRFLTDTDVREGKEITASSRLKLRKASTANQLGHQVK